MYGYYYYVETVTKNKSSVHSYIRILTLSTLAKAPFPLHSSRFMDDIDGLISTIYSPTHWGSGKYDDKSLVISFMMDWNDVAFYF